VLDLQSLRSVCNGISMPPCGCPCTYACTVACVYKTHVLGRAAACQTVAVMHSKHHHLIS
jgi:hypothetical protein